MNPEPKKAVLVIDDDSALREALHDTLLDEGFEVLTAPDGAQGLALTLTEHPDLIILDLLMPHIGGIEMLKRLRADVWGKHAKVLVLSNTDDLKRVGDALDVGVFDYFVKADTSLERLVEKVRQMMVSPVSEEPP